MADLKFKLKKYATAVGCTLKIELVPAGSKRRKIAPSYATPCRQQSSRSESLGRLSFRPTRPTIAGSARRVSWLKLS